MRLAWSFPRKFWSTVGRQWLSSGIPLEYNSMGGKLTRGVERSRAKVVEAECCKHSVNGKPRDTRDKINLPVHVP